MFCSSRCWRGRGIKFAVFEFGTVHVTHLATAPRMSLDLSSTPTVVGETNSIVEITLSNTIQLLYLPTHRYDPVVDG